MFIRLVTIVFLMWCFALIAFPQDSPSKSVERLIEELKDDNRELSDAAIDELASRKEKSLPALMSLARQTAVDAIVRARAILALSKIQDENSVPVLIKLLDDKESYVRGASASALSRIGGEQARIALSAFLQRCLEKDHENLPRATEAIKELPDARAFAALMKIVQIGLKQKSASVLRNREKDTVQQHSLRYAVEALGEIGDPRACESIAQLLDPSVYYADSPDYFYLEAIYKTRGEGVVPYLLSYLEKLVGTMKGKEQPQVDLGSENRQITHDYQSFQQAVRCLEIISGQNSLNATREDVLIFWRQFWKSKKTKSAQ